MENLEDGWPQRARGNYLNVVAYRRMWVCDSVAAPLGKVWENGVKMIRERFDAINYERLQQNR